MKDFPYSIEFMGMTIWCQTSTEAIELAGYVSNERAREREPAALEKLLQETTRRWLAAARRIQEVRSACQVANMLHLYKHARV